MGRERLLMRLHLLCMTQQYHLASMAAWLLSTGISNYNLLFHVPWGCSPAVISDLPLDCSTIPILQLPCCACGNFCPSPGFGSGCSVILLPFRSSQTASLTASNASCPKLLPQCRDWTLFQFPPIKAWPILLTSSRTGQLFFHPTKFCMILLIIFHW